MPPRDPVTLALRLLLCFPLLRPVLTRLPPLRRLLLLLLQELLMLLLLHVQE